MTKEAEKNFAIELITSGQWSIIIEIKIFLPPGNNPGSHNFDIFAPYHEVIKKLETNFTSLSFLLFNAKKLNDQSSGRGKVCYRKDSSVSLFLLALSSFSLFSRSSLVD